jgi:hypothetical protein
MDEEKDQHVTAAPVTVDNVQIEQDGNGWRMPEPVFRQSSGSLPESFERKARPDYGGVNAATAAAVASPPAAMPAPAPVTPAPAVTAVQPQPDLAEQFPPEPVEESAPEKPTRSRAMKIVFALLGIAAMVIFAIVFLSVIYCLFFNESGCQDIYYYFRPSDSPGF